SYVETPEEIGQTVARTDVGLCLDTGHLVLGGGDPHQALSDWAGRINHLHLTDVRQAVIDCVIAREGVMPDIWPRGAFCPLGEGVDLKTAGWTYLSLRTVRCRADEVLAGETGADETALIWLGGRAEVDGFGRVGDREDVFSGLPSALLLPPGASYKLRAQTPLHLAIVSAPAESAPPARLVRPDEVRIEIRGKGITERKIHWILSEKDPAARLLLVEVLTPAGHWSTYPPHKHDADTPGVERALEELYYYRFNPDQGFAFQGIYTKPSPSPPGGGHRRGDLNVSIRTRHDDLVLLPRG